MYLDILAEYAQIYCKRNDAHWALRTEDAMGYGWAKNDSTVPARCEIDGKWLYKYQYSTSYNEYIPHSSSIHEVKDSIGPFSVSITPRAVNRGRLRLVEDVESLHLDISTYIWSRSCSSVTDRPFGGPCPRCLALQP